MDRSHVRDPALEAAIARDLAGTEDYLVYADWLASRGHPRGELILVQHGLTRDPEDPELLAAQARLLDDHREVLFCEGAAELARVEVDWHMGFWRAARIELEAAATSTAGVELVLAHPSAALLESLTIHGASSSTGEVFRNVATLLSEPDLSDPALPVRRTLRTLGLGSREVPLRWSPARLANSLPRLEHLELRSSSLDHNLDWQLPRLRSFTLLTQALDRPRLRCLRRSLPAGLTALTLDVRNSDLSSSDVEPILDGSSHPGLTRLGLLGFIDTVGLVAALRRSPLLPQLQEIGLRPAFGWRFDEELPVLLRDPALASKRLFTSADASAVEHYNFGLFLRVNLHRPADAIVAFEAALRSDPEDVATWMGHGNAHADLGRQLEAERSFREALRIDPTHRSTWNNLALCFKRQGRFAEALDAFRRSVSPDKPPLGSKLHCIGHMLQELGEHDEARRTLAAAIDWYTEALSDDPDNGELLFWRGAAHARLQQRVEALADLGRAIACDEQWREAARTEEDFVDLREDPQFLALLTVRAAQPGCPRT